MDNIVNIPEETTKDITEMVRGVNLFQIVDNKTFVEANEKRKTVDRMAKSIKDHFKPLKEAANKTHKMITQAEKAELLKLKPAINHYASQILAWEEKQERIRQAEEARLRKIAEKEEEERKLAEAEELEKEGKPEEAEEVLEEQTFVPAPVVAKLTPKLQETRFVETWSFSIENELKVPRQFLKLDEVKIRKFVIAMKESASIEGIKIFKTRRVQ